MDENGYSDVKISLAMIVRNCAEDLDVCLASVAEHVDEIVIVNTAETPQEDGWTATNAVAEKYGAHVYQFPWCNDFSAARNFSFEKCTYDRVMWLDSDDELINPEKLINNARRAFHAGMHMVMVQYLYEWDDNGNCTTALMRERFVDRRWFKWKAPIHECLCATWKAQAAAVPPAGGQVTHRRRVTQKDEILRRLHRNKDVFEKSFAKDDPEARMLFYWGNTLMGIQDWRGALEKYQKYLPLTGNPAEKSVALNCCAECHRFLGEYDKALLAAQKAISVTPASPTPYLQVAEAYFGLRDYNRAIFYANEVERHISNESREMVHNPKALAGRPNYIIACCLIGMGKIYEAEKFAVEAAKYYADDEQLRYILGKIEETKHRDQVMKSMLLLSEELKKDGDTEFAEQIFVKSPKCVEGEYEVARHVPRVLPEGKRTIAFHCGGYSPFGEWGPASIKDGIGGSEEAVINMSREFARLGWHVEVYNSIRTPMEVDGVHWRPASHWRGHEDHPLDVVICWRNPSLPIDCGISARSVYLWCHDVPDPGGWERNHHKLFTGVMVLSEYHRRLYEFVPDDYIFLTRNGMDDSLFVPLDDLKNVPTRMIWGSCPSRGLERILEQWGEIRKSVPNAEIHCFYGWGPTFMKHMNDMGPLSYLANTYNKVEKLRKQPGVHWHGMVGQKALAKEYSLAGVWGYPTSFPEIHCITAWKAQAHGCWPICTDDYALSESVQYGVKMAEHPEKNIELWRDTVIDHMLHPPSQEDRLEMAKWARKNTWAEVAKEWEAKFSENLGHEPMPQKLARGDWKSLRSMLSMT